MPQLFDIKKVTVGPKNLVADVVLAPGAPVMTDEDIEATARIYDLMPQIADHLCLGDADKRFKNVMGATETAHLLEHVTVELLARTDIAGDIAAGQTEPLDEGAWQITFACPDDVLVAGALSSAAWIMQWAFSGGGEPRPDVEAIVDGLVALVQSLDADAPQDEKSDEPEAPLADEEAAEDEPAPTGDEPEDVAAADDEPEEPADAPAPEETPADAEPEPEPEAPAAESDGWDMDNVPRPHLVR